MSYDFYIAVDTGGAEPHYIAPVFDDEIEAFSAASTVAGNVAITASGYARCGNYTSNVSVTWMRCLTAALERMQDPLEKLRCETWRGDDDGRMRERYESQRDREIDTARLCLRDLHGKPADALIPLLRAAVEWGIEHIDELREDNPTNGWGNAEGAVTYLWDIQRMCERHPRGRLEISS